MADDGTEPQHVDLISDETGDPLADREAERQKAEEPDEDEAERERKRKIVKQALGRFKLWESAFGAQRKREIEDLKFDRALPEDQWPEGVMKSRQGSTGPDGRVIPELPTLTIPKLDQPVQQVLAEARSARLAIQVKPKGNGASRDDAEMWQGMIRAYEVDSGASAVRMWALERASKCGFGAYRMLKQYLRHDRFETPSLDEHDQELVCARILNQHSVYLDPFAQKPDWSDGEWGLITSDLPEDIYNERYDQSEMANLSALQLTAIGDQVPGWVTDSEEGRSIRVAEYFYVEHRTRVRVFLGNGVGPKWKEELPEGVYDYAQAHGHIENEREVYQRTVKWCVINATEVLQEEEWEGSYIPIIPVIGKEYNVKGDRCFKGIISNAKDAQRSYNVMRSEQVATVGLASKAQVIMAEGQDEGYEDQWDNANVRRYTRLIYKPTTFDGNLVPPPTANTFGNQSAIQAIGVAVYEADQDIKATTGRQDPSLGKPNSRSVSGKAIKNLQMAGESTTSVYLDNLATQSMALEGRMFIDLAPHVYDRPGRIARLLGDEDKESTVMLNQPFVMGKDGQPQNAPPPAPPGIFGRVGEAVRGAVGMPKPPGPEVKHYDLKKGTFNVVVSVGRKFETKREESNAAMVALAQAAPQLVPVFADLWVAMMDGPGMKQIADRLKRANPAAKGETTEQGQSVPPEAQAMIQAAQQRIEQLQHALQQTMQQLQQQTIDAQLQMQLKQMDIASKEKIELIKAKTALVQTESQINADRALAVLDAEMAKLEMGLRQLHEQRMLAMSHAHEMQGQILEAATAPAPQ